MGNHLHPTFLGKDWFCLRFCWEKNWKHRYVLKALCQNCNPELLFPWSPILQRNILPNIRIPFPRLPWRSRSVGKGYSAPPSLSPKRQRDWVFQATSSQSIKKGPALWNMAGGGWTGKGLQFSFLELLFWARCFSSEIIIYRHLVVPLSSCLERQELGV